MTTAEKPHSMLPLFRFIKGRPSPAPVTRVTQKQIRIPTSPSKFGLDFPQGSLSSFPNNIPLACYPVRGFVK